MFLAVTGFIAWHAIRFRDEHGDPDLVRLLFGCIAAVFSFRVLFKDVLGVVRFRQRDAAESEKRHYQ